MRYKTKLMLLVNKNQQRKCFPLVGHSFALKTVRTAMASPARSGWQTGSYRGGNAPRPSFKRRRTLQVSSRKQPPNPTGNSQKLSPGLNSLKGAISQHGDFFIPFVLAEQSVLRSCPPPNPPTESLDPVVSSHDIHGAALPRSTASDLVIRKFAEQ